jgi:hypothetical protein
MMVLLAIAPMSVESDRTYERRERSPILLQINKPYSMATLVCYG